MPIEAARKRLAWIWFTGFLIIILTLLVQLIGQAWRPRFLDAANWVVPHLGPTTGLVLATFARQATTTPTGTQPTVDRFFLNLTAGIALVHLSLVWAFLAAGGVYAHFSQAANLIEARFALLEFGNFFLGLVQGGLATAFGVFFISESKE